MKFRHFVLIVLLVGGFWYFTSYRRAPVRLPIGAEPTIADRSPLELTEAHAQPSYDSEELNNIAVYKKALSSVVNVTSSAVAYDFFYGAVPQQGQGTGFILDKQGRILTNYHVILPNSRKIVVTLSDKHPYSAKLLGGDQAHDLALLQIQAPDLVPATLSDSRGLVVGQKSMPSATPSV